MAPKQQQQQKPEEKPYWLMHSQIWYRPIDLCDNENVEADLKQSHTFQFYILYSY